MTGTVEDTNLRQFVLRDLENNRIVVPNSLVGSNALVNFQHIDSRSYKAVEIGVSYASDLEKALGIMVEELSNHPLQIDGRSREQIAKGDPEIAARVAALGDSAGTLKARVWAKTPPTGLYCTVTA